MIRTLIIDDEEHNRLRLAGMIAEHFPVIRVVGGYPEGVSYSIILMNTAVPLIDRHTRPRTYGEVEGS